MKPSTAGDLSIVLCLTSVLFPFSFSVIFVCFYLYLLLYLCLMENETEHSGRSDKSALFDICALSFLILCDWICVLVFVFVVVFMFIGK